MLLSGILILTALEIKLLIDPRGYGDKKQRQVERMKQPESITGMKSFVQSLPKQKVALFQY